LGMLSPILNGQTEQQVLPSELKEQTVITEPVTLRKGFLRAAFYGAYSFIDKIMDDSGNREYVLSSNGWARSWEYQFSLEYGITDRLQVYLWPGFVNKKFFYTNEYHFGATTETVYANQSAVGLADLTVGADYQILTETDSRPSLVAMVAVLLPTGKKNPRSYLT